MSLYSLQSSLFFVEKFLFSPLEFVVVVDIAVLALAFGIDKTMAGVGAISRGPATTILVVAVITHPHSIYW